MATPLRVEVLVHAPTFFHHCQHCELVFHQTGFTRGVRDEQIASALPEDLHQEYAAMWRWARRVVDAYQDRVAVKVIDVTSPAGVWKALRHRLHRYPAIVVDGREKFLGTDLAAADAVIGRRLGERADAPET